MSAANSVLDDVRRALGRNVTKVPEVLPPFIEPHNAIELTGQVNRFIQEASAVRAQIHQCSKPQLNSRVAEICATLKGELAISESSLFPESDLSKYLESHGVSILKENTLDHDQMIEKLANCAAGLTTADYAIAETGTIVLSSDEKNSLLVSLLPPVHIAVIRADQIFATLAEVIGLIGSERSGRPAPARSVSFITGPSRTSDVELVLSIGVHGPKELHVIILDS